MMRSITGAPTPSLEILLRRRTSIFARLSSCDANYVQGDHVPESVHGQFGPTEAWPSLRPFIDSFLRREEGRRAVAEVVGWLAVGTYWGDVPAVLGQLQEQMLSFVQRDLLPQIDQVVGDARFTQTALSERLASAGILPMFGFPTRVRLLFTNIPHRGFPWPPERGTVDRDLDIAISQFAPGSET